MKRLRSLALGAIAAAFVGLGATAASACDKTLDVVNHSNHTVTYVSTNGYHTGERHAYVTIPPGYHLRVNFNDDSGYTDYFLHAEGTEGSSWDTQTSNLCSLVTWNLWN